ncbi:purine catabolism regulator [Solirubrobacter pauli]|uniref:Purine catabolism regulator n=1 Tax=Solirubrobacter pauli TaxID=166793 RepID=A0A660LHR0_9ACTN|nr:PucR family transcriptional regulator ligand-binding domain-containing protein [Solirubrobacter pauli]RKQ93520.1 purine catabolism regulator [Solirubrobacter pauli]
MLPLRELLRELELEVVAGATGLDNPLRWVHISELEDPTPWLSGGELLLTTGLGLGDERQQRAYVERLAGHGLAGLGFGTGFSHAGVPEALRAAAEAQDFPVFEVPYATPFIAITERAAAQLVNEQYAVLRRALSAHERLEQVVLSERGLEGVASELGTMIGGPALILDARGEVLAARGRVDPAGVVRELRERLEAGVKRGYAPEAEDFPAGALALPVSRSGAALPEAWLVAARANGPLNELDRLTLHQAVTIVALELLRRRVVDDTERRLAGDVLSALVAGDLAGAELARRLEPFGVRERAGVLVLAPPRGVRAVAEEALARAVREEAGGGLVAPAGALLCALLPTSGDDELFALAGRLLARVEQETGATLPAGAGRCVAPGELRRGFHEARCALEARALAVGGSGSESGIATYRDLGSFQLLLSLQDDDALRLFCDSILAPIEDSEGAYGGELMRSLEAFIECNGQWERAAKALFCHRHTLRYRIRRVEELTGRSLDSARDRIDFWLALRGRELIQPER